MGRRREVALKIVVTIVLALCALLALPVFGQQPPGMSVGSSEALFSVMAAINACGYDAGLSQSLPIRQQVRGEVRKAAQSEQAQAALHKMCGFYEDHRQESDSLNLSNYVSLALNMTDSPKLELRTKESDLAPDAGFVLGFLPLLRSFSEAVNLDATWQKHRAEYEQLVESLHPPIRETVYGTDVYLRRNLSGYVKHDFGVFVEPMAAPGEVNSRNYGEDYFLVVSPTGAGEIRLDLLRHTYLHYLLDGKALSRGTTLERLTPLLDSVKHAPLDENYRDDMGMLLTESLIRAIEARMLGGRKGSAKAKEQLAWDSTRQGFILTEYFYDRLVAFEGDEAEFDQAYADWLHDLDVTAQQKFAATVPFLSSSTPEVVHKSQPKELLAERAERALDRGDVAGARNDAQQALDAHEDRARSLFVLARAAVASGQMSEAQKFFEQAAAAASGSEATEGSANESTIRGWSHIYLGRILDMQEHRQEAVENYRAALREDGSPELKAAAEKGLQQAYQAPAKRPHE